MVDVHMLCDVCALLLCGFITPQNSSYPTRKTIIVDLHPLNTMATLQHHQRSTIQGSTTRPGGRIGSHVVVHPTPICRTAAPRCALFGSPNALHRRVHASAKRCALVTKASLQVTDDATGIQFPLVQEFW